MIALIFTLKLNASDGDSNVDDYMSLEGASGFFVMLFDVLIVCSQLFLSAFRLRDRFLRKKVLKAILPCWYKSHNEVEMNDSIFSL